MRKVLAALIMCLAACALLGVMTSAETDAGSPEERALRFGQLERMRVLEAPADGAPGAEVRVKAESFVITAHELDCSIAGYEMNGYGRAEAEKLAVKSLSTQKAVLSEAKRRGYTADRQVILDRIEEQKKIAPTASNYGEFESFLRGIGLEADQYWDTQYATFERAEIVGRFRQDLLEVYKEQTRAKGAASEDFEAYYDGIAKKILENEHITLIKG